MALPDVVEGEDGLAFSVPVGKKLKGFCWAWMERVEPKKPRVPRPDVLVVRVPDLEVKETLLASDPETFFTEAHYDGFPAVFVRLKSIKPAALRELLIDAWSSVAPKASIDEFSVVTGRRTTAN
jgi:hypothetical protein